MSTSSSGAMTTARLVDELLDEHSPLNLDGLLDALTALVSDCNYPVLRRVTSIDRFVAKYEQLVKRVLEQRLKDTDFSLIKVIGRGAFGEIQLVRHVRTKTVFAMKLLNKHDMMKRSDAAFFWEERDIMAQARSEWIVRLHYAFQDQKYLYMVMEYMPGGDMVNLMTNYDVSEKWTRFYTAELVEALAALHSMGFIHRDVKPDNLLIGRNGHLKLADFGTCVRLAKDGKVRSSSAVGTPDYICPELLRNGPNTELEYGVEVDWWSVGVFVYELLYGETPFYAEALVNTYANIMKHKETLAFPQDMEASAEAQNLIRAFLSEPDCRLGRSGPAPIRAHPFFRNSDWTFDSIRNAVPPFIPNLKGDDDTSMFTGVNEDERPKDAIEAFQIPKAFTGTQLPFIGFTFAADTGPIGEIKKRLASPAVIVENGAATNRRPSLAERTSAESEEMARNARAALLDAEEKLRALTREHNEATLRLESTKKELEAKETRVRELETERTQGAERVDREIQEQRERLRVALEEADRARRNEEKTRQKMAETTAAAATAERRFAAVQQEISELTASARRADEMLVEERNGAERATTRVQELEERVATLKRDLATQDARERELSKEMLLLREQNNMLQDQQRQAISGHSQSLELQMQQLQRSDQDEGALDEARRELEGARVQIRLASQESAQLKARLEATERDLEMARRWEDEATQVSRQLASARVNEDAIRQQLARLDSDLQAAKAEVRRSADEAQLARLQLEDAHSQLDTAEQLAKMWKEETILLKERDERDRALDKAALKEAHADLDRSRRELDAQRLARQIAEANLGEHDRQLSMLNFELREMMARHEKEIALKDNVIRMKEAELADAAAAAVTAQQAQVDAISLNGSTKGEEIEQLRRKLELSNRNRDLVIQKLEQVLAERIAKDAKDQGGGKNVRKLESELRRKDKELRQQQQRLVSFEGELRSAAEQNDRTVQELMSQLSDEQQRADDLQMERDELRDRFARMQQMAGAEQQPGNGAGGAQQTPQSQAHHQPPHHPSSSHHQPPGIVALHHQHHHLLPQVVLEDVLALKARRAPGGGGGKKKAGKGLGDWEEHFALLTRHQLLLFARAAVTQLQDGGNGLSEHSQTPTVALDVRAISIVRRVTAADLRSASAQQLQQIFHVMYDDEDGGANGRPSGSTNDLTTAAGGNSRHHSSVSDLSQGSGETSTNGGVPKKKDHRHDFQELVYHMPTNCDFCMGRLSDVFRPKPALECKNCHYRIHKEHRDANLTMCGARAGKELLLMAASAAQCTRWVTTLQQMVAGIMANNAAALQHHQQQQQQLPATPQRLPRAHSSLSSASSGGGVGTPGGGSSIRGGRPVSLHATIIDGGH